MLYGHPVVVLMFRIRGKGLLLTGLRLRWLSSTATGMSLAVLSWCPDAFPEKRRYIHPKPSARPQLPQSARRDPDSGIAPLTPKKNPLSFTLPEPGAQNSWRPQLEADCQGFRVKEANPSLCNSGFGMRPSSSSAVGALMATSHRKSKQASAMHEAVARHCSSHLGKQ